MRRHHKKIFKLFVCFCAFFSFIYLFSPTFIDDQINQIGRKKLPDYNSSGKIDWEDYDLYAEEEARSGPGEHGVGVRIEPAEKDQSMVLYRQNGFHVLASDKMALNRSLKDIRHPDCKKLRYLAQLPTVSIIIPFYEEHWSTLLRTFVSALVRAPKHLVKEVILVDDGSTKAFLKTQLDDYLSKNYPDGKVRVIHQLKREGLIRTRLTGARAATGDVLIFLDSHCEANRNWLPPLLEPIALDYRTVVCPFIDVLDAETFEYRAQDEGARGAFDWEFYYKRLPRLPEDDKNPAMPFDSPVMAGGLFAISKKWFWELGGYDTGLEIWGGEQYELSFKIWMCGGRMIDTPCSRIGHAYRTYSPFPNPGIGDFIGKNYRRVAEVWMDEYKEYLYNRRPHYRNIDPGDIKEQMELRQRLKCKSFKWFMTEVAFDLVKKYPMEEPVSAAVGELRSNANPSLCVDALGADVTHSISLKPCMKDKPDVNGLQQFEYSWHDDVRLLKGSDCFDVPISNPGSPIIFYPCHASHGNQAWEIIFAGLPDQNPLMLRHRASGMCMDSDAEHSTVFVKPCEKTSKTQWWRWTTLQSQKAAESRKRAGL